MVMMEIFIWFWFSFSLAVLKGLIDSDVTFSSGFLIIYR
jgi:hypothetical protein